MPEFIATATATSILGVVGKAAGTVAGIGPVKDWLHGCKKRALAGRAIPHNHDLVKGVRTAHICALDHIARRYTKLLTTFPDHEIGSDDHAFANNLRAFIDARLKILSDQNIDHDVLSADDINDVLEHLATATTHQSYADLNRKAQADCEERALQEITRDAGRTPPALFVRLFKGKNEDAGWYEAFSLFVTEELKANDRFRSIFFATELVDIRGMLNELVHQKRTEFPDLSGFVTDVKRQLDRMEDKLDRLQETVDQLVTALAQNQKLSRKLEAANVTKQKVIAIAGRTARNINDFDQALKELESHAEIAIEVEKEGRGGSNLGAFVDAVLARVREKYDANDFDAAAEEADEGFAEWEQREAERRTESLQEGLKILEAGLNQDILRRNAASAASRIARICELNHPEKPSTALNEAYDEWFKRGGDAGLNFDLEIAVEIATLGLDSASGQDQRGKWLNNLGTAFGTLGERESGAERLEQAIDAFQSALDEYTQESFPLFWASTQTNLGNALQTLGERESGTQRLKLAIDAFGSALEEFTQDRAPLAWASTQHNLGTALGKLGERESSEERLEQAVTAYQLALKERRQDRDPLAWARTQNNLGSTLCTLGQFEKGTKRLKLAVTAHQSALKERQRDRVPLEWAITQNNLGTALQALGEREGGTERLEQAVAAYQSALEEFTQERVPIQWAGTLFNEAEALGIIAERTLDLTLAKQALSQGETALKAFQQAGLMPYAERCTGMIESTRALIKKLGG